MRRRILLCYLGILLFTLANFQSMKYFTVTQGKYWNERRECNFKLVVKSYLTSCKTFFPGKQSKHILCHVLKKQIKSNTEDELFQQCKRKIIINYGKDYKTVSSFQDSKEWRLWNQLYPSYLNTYQIDKVFSFYLQTSLISFGL